MDDIEVVSTSHQEPSQTEIIDARSYMETSSNISSYQLYLAFFHSMKSSQQSWIADVFEFPLFLSHTTELILKIKEVMVIQSATGSRNIAHAILLKTIKTKEGELGYPLAVLLPVINDLTFPPVEDSIKLPSTHEPHVVKKLMSSFITSHIM